MHLRFLGIKMLKFFGHASPEFSTSLKLSTSQISITSGNAVPINIQSNALIIKTIYKTCFSLK